MKQTLSIRGRLKISVLENGIEVQSRDWQKNLLLDQGLNRLAVKTFAELFEFAAKGTGTTATKEAVTGTYTLASVTITRASGARDFVIGDIGKLIRNQDGQEAIITAFTDATHVDVRAVGSGSLTNYTGKTITIYNVNQTGLTTETGDRTDTYSAISGQNSTTDGTGSTKNERTLKRTFIFDPEAENKETVTGSYTWATTTVTRSSGARDFTSGDVGKYVKFSATLYAKISVYTDATHVTVDRSGTASGSIEIYGFQSYSEIGLSDTETAGNNLNIRVRLEDGGGLVNPVILLGANPETPGQQLLCTYETTITLTPDAITSSVQAPISDPESAMSGNKAYISVIEAMALSRIETDGDTNLQFAGLEPAITPYLGMSTVATALVSFAGPDRSAGAASVAMTADAYVTDSFRVVQRGTFELNDAIGTNWRTVGLVDPDSDQFLFTMLFGSAQKKDGSHSMTLAFVKSWNRDLS